MYEKLVPPQICGGHKFCCRYYLYTYDFDWFLMSIPPNFPPRKLPSQPPKMLNAQPPKMGSLPQNQPVLNPQSEQVKTTSMRETNQISQPKPFAPAFQDEEVYVDDEMFNSIPQLLKVNEQPFFRWFRRVFLALIVMSIFIGGVGWFVKAPIELIGVVVLISWSIVILFALPEAIVPYKKTTIDLVGGQVRVGRTKQRPLSDITSALLDKTNKNVRVWLGFDKKDGFWVPLKSTKFRMKHEDLLALRATIPQTKIDMNVPEINVDVKKLKKEPISKQQLVNYIETLI